MKTYFGLFLCCLFFTACSSTGSDPLPVEQELLLKLKTHEDIQTFMATFPYAFVSEVNYCATHDCQERLRESGFDIKVYAKEDAFMRKLEQYIVIEEINTTAEPPYLKFRLEDNTVPVSSGMILL